MAGHWSLDVIARVVEYHLVSRYAKLATPVEGTAMRRSVDNRLTDQEGEIAVSLRVGVQLLLRPGPCALLIAAARNTHANRFLVYFAPRAFHTPQFATNVR